MNTEKNHPYLTAKIVGSYVGHHKLTANELSDLITSVHRAMTHLGQSPELEEVLIPAVSVRRSVRQDYVVCLDCGYRGKTLRRHISTQHGMSRDEYLRRWGLRSDHPLTAPAYSERRSTMAKAFGLGRKSTTPLAPVAIPMAAGPGGVSQVSEATPNRKGRSRSRSKPNVAGEAAAAPTSARKRQSRAQVASPSA
jgi:predicted transcriptional regulator